mmetsp:Transcript_11267/g.29981  ORF Transcript_11267/g.29981 Transcript_11267/m.29981 type:complete len:290 (+) Transcript_11267:209-1078(+)
MDVSASCCLSNFCRFSKESRPASSTSTSEAWSPATPTPMPSGASTFSSILWIAVSSAPWAMSMQVRPSAFLTKGSTPRSTKNSRTLPWLPCTALCRGVHRDSSRRWRSAPNCASSFRTSRSPSWPAQWAAERPWLSTAPTSLDASGPAWATSWHRDVRCSWVADMRSAVLPSASLAPVSAPRRRSTCTEAAWPPTAAHIRGVCRRGPGTSTEKCPASRAFSTNAASPLKAAQWSSVAPFCCVSGQRSGKSARMPSIWRKPPRWASMKSAWLDSSPLRSLRPISSSVQSR